MQASAAMSASVEERVRERCLPSRKDDRDGQDVVRRVCRHDRPNRTRHHEHRPKCETGANRLRRAGAALAIGARGASADQSKVVEQQTAPMELLAGAASHDDQEDDVGQRRPVPHQKVIRRVCRRWDERGITTALLTTLSAAPARTPNVIDRHRLRGHTKPTSRTSMRQKTIQTSAIVVPMLLPPSGSSQWAGTSPSPRRESIPTPCASRQCGHMPYDRSRPRSRLGLTPPRHVSRIPHPGPRRESR